MSSASFCFRWRVNFPFNLEVKGVSSATTSFHDRVVIQQEYKWKISQESSTSTQIQVQMKLCNKWRIKTETTNTPRVTKTPKDKANKSARNENRKYTKMKEQMSVTLTDINIILVLNKYHRVNHKSNKILIIQKALYRSSLLFCLQNFFLQAQVRIQFVIYDCWNSCVLGPELHKRWHLFSPSKIILWIHHHCHMTLGNCRRVYWLYSW
jgi:hypothetical protein